MSGSLMVITATLIATYEAPVLQLLTLSLHLVRHDMSPAVTSLAM